MAQKLLRHSNIKTSAKYAHVFDDELRDALDKMPVRRRRIPPKVPSKGPKSAKKKKNAKAWEAAILPLNYARLAVTLACGRIGFNAAPRVVHAA